MRLKLCITILSFLYLLGDPADILVDEHVLLFLLDYGIRDILEITHNTFLLYLLKTVPDWLHHFLVIIYHFHPLVVAVKQLSQPELYKWKSIHSLAIYLIAITTMLTATIAHYLQIVLYGCNLFMIVLHVLFIGVP